MAAMAAMGCNGLEELDYCGITYHLPSALLLNVPRTSQEAKEVDRPQTQPGFELDWGVIEGSGGTGLG